jgi:hypothetical protein
MLLIQCMIPHFKAYLPFLNGNRSMGSMFIASRRGSSALGRCIQSLNSMLVGLCTDGPRYARVRTRNQYCHLARRISFAICLQISEHDIELSIVVIRSHDEILDM